MSYEINVDKYAFAQAAEPEKVDENYSAVLVRKLVSEETKQREALGATLEQSILNEVYARTGGDLDLKGQIDSEALTRSAEISALDTKLRGETDARILKDEELSVRLTEETRQRAAADTSFLQAVDKLEADISIESAQRVASHNELSNKLELKANVGDVYTKSYIDQSLTGLKTDIAEEQNARYAADNDLLQQINLKANEQDVYTKSYIDSSLLEIKNAVADEESARYAADSDLLEKINLKANQQDVYTKSYIDSALSIKCDNTRADALEQEVLRIDNSKENKTVILTDLDNSDFTFHVFQMYNGEYRCNVPLESLSLEFDDEEYVMDYISSLSFDCGEGLTEVSYPASKIITWVGTDCDTAGGFSVFQPVSGTHYDIIFYFNGLQFIGLVNGYTPATGNEAA